MAALTVKTLPEGNEWLYEIKWDGYRALLIKDGNNVQLRSRNNLNPILNSYAMTTKARFQQP